MQVDIKPALNHFQIRTFINGAVQDVRNLINFDTDFDLQDNEALVLKLKGMSKLERAQMLVNDIFGAQVKFTSLDEAVIMTQCLVEHALKNDGVMEDVDMTVMAATKRCHDFINNPTNKWLFVKPESVAADTVTETQTIGGVETVVAVNTKGEFKKGEKERLAIELYQNWVKVAKDPTNNQEFIKILMDELGMTKAGATTYNYNMKKKMGGVIKAKPKRA